MTSSWAVKGFVTEAWRFLEHPKIKRVRKAIQGGGLDFFFWRFFQKLLIFDRHFKKMVFPFYKRGPYGTWRCNVCPAYWTSQREVFFGLTSALMGSWRLRCRDSEKHQMSWGTSSDLILTSVLHQPGILKALLPCHFLLSVEGLVPRSERKAGMDIHLYGRHYEQPHERWATVASGLILQSIQQHRYCWSFWGFPTWSHFLLPTPLSST